MYSYELELWNDNTNFVAGVDEVGRGCVAGPVVAAAVILPKYLVIEGINDSKKLSEKKRNLLDIIIREHALAYSIAELSAQDVDNIGIVPATKKVMLTAIKNLHPQANHVLIDAMQLSELTIPQTNIVKGDSLSASIAAASIIAKVYRDKKMIELAVEYDKYSFEKHKGYGTKLHFELIEKNGISDLHRKSFLGKILT